MIGYSLRLKDIQNEWKYMFVYPINNYPYYYCNWYKSMFQSNDVRNYSNEEIANIFYSKYGNREILIDDDIMNADYNNDNEYKTAVANYCGTQLGVLFLQNWRKYESYWNALIDKTYNPIWNVDGTEIKTYTKENSGSVESDNIKSGNITDDTTTTYTGSEQTSNTGTDTDIQSGNKSTTKNGTRIISEGGTDSNVKSGNETRATVPSETDSFYNTEKNSYNDITDTKSYGKTETESYNQYNETETYNDITNERTINTTETKQFNNRTDTDNKTTTYNNVKDNNIRVDDLKEEYSETLTRQGNIGVTKSQDLVESEMQLRARYDLMTIIQSDIASYILYSC